MTRDSQRIRRIATVLPFLLLVGCAGGLRTQSHGGPAATALPTLCPQPTPINDAGLTDAQRNQLYQSAEKQGWQCYAAWVANLDPSTLQWRALGHTGMQARCVAPEGTSLAQAKANATLIVSGTVVSLTPQSTRFGTNVTVAVTQVFKGQAGNVITVLQGSGLEPLDNGHTTVIVDMDCAPLLLPNDSVFLFLKSAAAGLYPESYTGIYYVRGEQIQTLEFNPFASQVNRQSPAEFATAITNA